MSVGQVSINTYATKKQATVMKQAMDFASEAKDASGQVVEYVPTSTDKQLAEAFGAISEANKEKLKSAQEYLAAAAWLEDRPSLAEVLLERKELTRHELGKLIGEHLVGGSTKGMSVNSLWADTAVRLGHLSKDVALAYLKDIPTDEKHLTLPETLLAKGELTARQELQVRDTLRERIQRKGRSSGDQAR